MIDTERRLTMDIELTLIVLAGVAVLATTCLVALIAAAIDAEGDSTDEV